MQALLATLLVCMGALHPGSFSRSRIVVQDTAVQHTMLVQVLSLIEALPIDPNDDLQLDADELDAARAAIGEYIVEHYSLRANGAQQPMSMHVERVEAFLEGTPDLPSSRWLRLELVANSASAIESLSVRETLFEVPAPAHIEYVSVAWAGQAPTDVIFHSGKNAHDFVPSGAEVQGALRSFFGLGLAHILAGYDHLCFLLALLAAVRGLRELAWVITAFTLAHSVTLGVAAMGWVVLPSSFVELAIALSIVYVAMENLLGLKRRSLWLEALVFGLLHGLGFAGFLSEALAGEEALLVPLIGFNLGVEAGQVLAVLPFAAVFALLARRRRTDDLTGTRATLVPKRLGQVISLFVALFGFYWFLERAGFLPG